MPAHTPPSTARILVAEDNRKLASFLSRALSEEGYVVDLVDDGAVAVSQARSVEYNLVILDWMLPSLDGLHVCRALRTAGKTVPILMLTARSDVCDRVSGLDAGADDFLPKPFDLTELLARVRALGRRGQRDRFLEVGQLRIDRQDRTVTFAGTNLDLTHREFMLLAYLAREAGRVVSRVELLQNVWETAYDPGTNMIDVHIKNLRTKLGEHATMIETVRGVGYRWHSEPGHRVA
ncbi:two-component system, OmpR family, response regulator [Nannocystis exedens]|uniref:Phosphate regulon transcriptional regulatory protein PhoB n=1 Tax=Nannocystis exedens TaxID=54 RepID=A0A1I1U3M9_9BACT|nr:response regulator transcription factor [Nannocystis exedens]PCC71319.1 DNA-binding response regulator [Nannocystis exedens]SFD64198.1 two-component system, OmpR family, response regulator [Nannocystis exedens]